MLSAPPRRPDNYAWLIVAAILFLLAISMAKCSGAETKWPEPAVETLTYAQHRNLPPILPVAVTIIRVSATGREESRAQATSSIKLEDWVALHWQTIDSDIICYEAHGFVRLTIVYCGDIL